MNAKPEYIRKDVGLVHHGSNKTNKYGLFSTMPICKRMSWRKIKCLKEKEREKGEWKEKRQREREKGRKREVNLPIKEINRCVLFVKNNCVTRTCKFRVYAFNKHHNIVSRAFDFFASSLISNANLKQKNKKHENVKKEEEKKISRVKDFLLLSTPLIEFDF